MMRVVIPRSRVRQLWRPVALGLVAVVALVLYFVPTTHHAIEYWWEPRPVPEANTLATQRSTAEDAMARAFAKGFGQLTAARALTLPVGAAEADSIVRDYSDQLRTLRRQALVSIARAYGLTGVDAERYVQATDPKLDTPPAEATSDVILVPVLYQIVQRVAEGSVQIADAGTTELTKPRDTVKPAPSPTPSATPAASPTPTPRP